MIILKATTETLEITTGFAADIDYSISYADITTTTFLPSTTEGKIITATTVIALTAPAASTQRQIKLITITNRHASTTNTILVKKDISGTEYYLTPTATLLAGETMQYIDGQGWKFYTSKGTLKVDGTIATGSNTSIQYNSNGIMSGDSDFLWDSTSNSMILNGSDTGILLKTITNEPVNPAANLLRMYVKNVSGRILPKFVGPAGVDTPIQPAFFSNNITMWNPTTATAGVWLGTAGAGAGTYSTGLPSFTNLYTSTKRARWANVATTANQVLGQRNTEAMYFRGSIASAGGFFFYARFGLDTWTTGGRLFVGMHTATTVVSAQPSASLNIVGFGVDAGDSAITFMHNDATVTAVKETIAGQPALASGNGYDAYVFARPNDSTVYFRLVNLNTNTEIINSSVSTKLPVATTGLTAGALASNAALTAVTSINLGLNRIYVETDF